MKRRALPLAIVAAAVSWWAQASADDPLPGRSHDFAYDGDDVGRPELAYEARLYVPPQASGADGALPLLVFLHGLNAAQVRHRWVGGGQEGDVRAMVQRLIDDGAVPPMLVVAPTSIVKSEVARGASWRRFDLDGFLELVQVQAATLPGGGRAIDPSRVIVAGHSGAGCSSEGGLATAGRSRVPLRALLVIDTCMRDATLEAVLAARPLTHVVVSYQEVTWSRPFATFERDFARVTGERPAHPGVLRVLDRQRLGVRARPGGRPLGPHDGTVELTLARWLPVVLGAVGPPPR